MRTKEKILNLIIGALITLILYMMFNLGVTLGRDDQLQDMRAVYTTCHANLQGKDCAQVQKDTNTEYLCNLSDNCWVEVK